MVGYGTILQHIDRLRLYIRRIHELQQHSKQEILTDWRVQFQVERALQLAIEVVISVTEQLIAILNLPIPDSNKKAVQALMDAGILPGELGEELKQAVGFRNIIVHGYMDIDYHLVYDAVQEDMVHLEQFVAQVAAFVKEQLPSDEQE